MKNLKMIFSVLPLLLAGCLAVFLTLENEYNEEKEERETARGRDEYRLMMRGGSWQPEKVMAARQFLKEQVETLQTTVNPHKRDAGINQWTELGPKDFSGRVRAIAVHPTDPNILFVGGVSGGIWKSTNGGASWTPLNDFLPSLSVTSILIHPTGPDTMYLSTGEAFVVSTAPGAGIFKSIDGGDTWNLIDALDPNNLTGFHWVNKLVFHPTDRTILFAATGGNSISSPGLGCGEIYKITGSGSGIIDLGTSNICLGTGLSVAVSAEDPDTILACFSGGLLVSGDGGQTWDPKGTSDGFLAVPGRVEVALDPANQSRIYALCENPGENYGVLMHSTNAGRTWATLNPTMAIFDAGGGENNGWYHNTVWVDPTNADIIIVGGVNLWRSTNRGISFIPISDWTEYTNGLSPHADQHIIVAASNYGPTNKKVYIGNDGGIVSTNNIGSAFVTTGWNLLNNNSFGTTQFYASGTSGQSPNRLIGGAQDNGVIMSTDNGTTWTHEITGDGGYCGFSSTSDLIYASTQRGKFYVNGLGMLVGWIPFEDLDVIDTSVFIAPMKIYPNDGDVVLMGGESLWRRDLAALTAPSTNVGPQPQINRFVTAIDIALDSSLVLVGYNNGSVYKATPGTWNWTLVSTSVIPDACSSWNGPITDIAIHPTNTDKIMISRGGYEDCNIIFTNDGGTTWQSRSDGIPALQVNCLTWHPDIGNWIYAGTDLGVMASENNGQDWNVMPNFGGSDGPAFVEVTELQFATASVFGTRTLTATTYGRGIWKTSTSVRKDIFIDEDCINCGVGTQSFPFSNISDAEDAQAHGQTWTIDAGIYTVPSNNKLVIDKKIGKVNTTNGSVIIGQN
ncbi:MAG: hypothetical protein KDC80_30320 [Saprospiraceae bacterium]|nr:hypothetical protein [Saprospiraceae bacterium]